MKVLSVVGARPQFVKLGPIASVFADSRVEHIIVHTGQHYDVAMSEVFFEDLGIPKPDVNLGIGSGSHGVQTGAMLAALDDVLGHHSPDWVLVYGDTNSTVAGALAAVKLHLPVAHLEAGLRSFNRRMPEEHNRVLTDHAADLLLAPSEVAMAHLRHEGLGERAINVGDVMTDVCYRTRDLVSTRPIDLPSGVDPARPFLLCTLHRPDNTDHESRLHAILEVLRQLPVPTVLVAHPRLVAQAKEFGLALSGGALVVCPPLAYPEMVRAMMGSVGVVTDSGGLQKEAYLLGVPCTTLRTETEWTETLVDDWNILDPELIRVRTVAFRQPPTQVQSAPYGDGAAAARVLTALQQCHAGEVVSVSD